MKLKMEKLAATIPWEVILLSFGDDNRFITCWKPGGPFN